MDRTIPIRRQLYHVTILQDYPILLEHTAEARDQATWNECMEIALAPLTCNVIQSTSDEAPGLLA